MNPEILTILNAGTIDPAQPTGTGEPELTPAMVAEACTGLGTKYYLAALIAICGDATQVKRLVDPFLLGDVSKRAVKEKWTYNKHDIKHLCEIACLEVHSPSQFNTDEKRGIALSIRTERIIIGEEYKRFYRRYYNIIYSMVEDYRSTAQSHIRGMMEE